MSHPVHPDLTPLVQDAQKLSHQNILVVGDLMLDQWMWGKVSRISPEAPVPVVDVNRTTYTPGGAANVVSNLLSLGSRVTVAGLVGDDDTGARLRTLLEGRGAQTCGLVVSAARRTTVKTRIIAHSQQVVRVDQEERAPFSGQESEPLKAWLESHLRGFDGVFLSDYDKGLFTSPSLEAFWPSLYGGTVPVIAGPKPANLRIFRGVDCLTLNASEAAVATGAPVDSEEATAEAGARLLELSQAKNVLITRGERGMTFFGREHEPLSERAFATEVFDVSGAGDTVLTVMGLGLCAGLCHASAIKLASHAAAVVVRKLGTATVTVEEIAESLQQRWGGP
jgi:D-beta-D-heptose 7-phosphate kinase/D-beta-D-heptose 1-phosphate adenosyltransferase